MTCYSIRTAAVALISLCFSPTLCWAATDVLLYVADSFFDTGSGPDIHLMRPDGTDHRLIRTDYPVTSASLMPDGQWIVYVSPARKELRQVHVSGEREKVLVRLRHSNGRKGPTDVRVSPNGRYVAYTRYYSQGRIGIEVYDTRTRRFSLRQIFGQERGRRLRNTIRRLLWTPDSKTVAASVDTQRFAASANRWINERATLVFSLRRNKQLRRLVYPEASDREPLDFVSNKELLLFGKIDPSIVALPNAMWRYNFVRNKSTRLFRTTALNDIQGLAVSPDQQSISMDVAYLNDNGNPWSSLSGTPRVQGFEAQRTFARLNLNTLAARYSVPKNAYSEMAQFRPENSATLYTSSFEWRSVRSAEAFEGSLCWGWRVTRTGTSGNDTIVGTRGADVIAAGLGDDNIKSGGGDDVICASDGNDIVNAGPGDDTVFGDIGMNQNNVSEIVYSGNDEISGSSGEDALHGHGGNDEIRGDAGNDLLFGGGDDDEVAGGKGEDDIYGGPGNDSLDGGPGRDTGNGGDGTDTCRRIRTTESCP